MSGARWTLVVGIVRIWVTEPTRRRVIAVRVVPVPPFVRWTLRVALRRVLPGLLAAQRRHVQKAPGVAQHLVAAVIDEVGAIHPVAVMDERIGAVPVVHAEVDVEAVGDR